MSSEEYAVVFEPFTKNHFVKAFEKKYKSAWVVTEQAMRAMLARADALLAVRRDKLDKIKICEQGVVYKYDFAVAGTHMSPKSSGNRCIVSFDTQRKIARVLLVYGKTHVTRSNETLWWKQVIRENYAEFHDLV